MRCPSLVLVLLTGLGGIAAAQPGPPPQPPPPVDTTTTTTTTTTVDPAPPDPTPPPPPQPEPAPRAMPVVQEEPVQTDRPNGFSIGLGLGYGLPTSLETPNRTSARFRLGSGLTFEPLLSIANDTDSSEVTLPGMAAMESEDKATEFGLAVLVRIPVITHNHVDLEALATAGFANAKYNDDGDFNSVTTNSFSLGWGVGIGYWLSRHWELSMSVTNPLVQYSKTKSQGGAADTSMTTSSTTLGVIFLPQVTAMIHLYN